MALSNPGVNLCRRRSGLAKVRDHEFRLRYGKLEVPGMNPLEIKKEVKLMVLGHKSRSSLEILNQERMKQQISVELKFLEV